MNDGNRGGDTKRFFFAQTCQENGKQNNQSRVKTSSEALSTDVRWRIEWNA